MNAQDLYTAGQLSEAIAAQNDEVRTHPADSARRSFLGELLCVAGNLERADAQFETIEKMHGGSGPAVGLIRQLIRAEKTRQEVHREGRVPDFLREPPQHVQLRLQAAAALREGDPVGATSLAIEAEELRPAAPGRSGGEAFDDFRDLDDLFGGVFEVLTSTGRYMWIPVEDVVSIVFDPPAQPLDLLWRPAEMDVRGGPDGKVFLPTVYGHDVDTADDAARLGRRTDWEELTGDGAVRGVGQRTFLVGEEARTILELAELELGAGVE
jgi:type VI secretion system protein ImpE